MALVCQRCQHDNSEEARYCLNCGAMLQTPTREAPADPFLGRVLLGRYRVLGVLGEGGMGKVYLAEQKLGTASRNVAIKTLHPELGADQQLVARFQRECETVISLSHPNTVQFYDFGEMDGTLFIVMEYIEGESLAHVLERGAIEPGRADRILIQICGSLHEAHQRGIVHRDLKPENVLLTERGGQGDFVKVLDFGIAKSSEAEDKAQAKLTKQGMVLGTPPYMSPEQFSGQTLDARSDIYSLGIMTYEMLTGRLPFEAATPWEWATKHLTAQPTPLEAHPEGAALPEHKRAAIYRALQKDREQRQAHVLELMHELTGLNDPSHAWTLAAASGTASAAAPGSPSAPAPQARPAAPTPGPMSATDAAYAPTMATPASGQMAAAGSVRAGPAGPRAARMAKLFATLAVAGLLLLAGGAGALWWAFGGAEEEAAAEHAPADAASAGAVDEPGATGGVPSTPSAPDEAADTEAEDTPSEEPAEPAAAKPNEEGSDDAPAEAPPQERSTPDKPRRSKAREAAARAQTLLGSARSALDRGDVGAAATALARARRTAGRTAGYRELQGQLARKASNQVGILMQQGRCREAQALFRRLESAGADGPSRVHFSPDWCPRP
ncbi:MAG: protein kinase domain-containing protein [Myxococcota bacterium]